MITTERPIVLHAHCGSAFNRPIPMSNPRGGRNTAHTYPQVIHQLGFVAGSAMSRRAAEGTGSAGPGTFTFS